MEGPKKDVLYLKCAIFSIKMLLNVSYKDREIDAQIEAEVGRPFSLKERFKLRGIGSPGLPITAASIGIHNLLILDHNTNSCNIEMRPGGIIIRFRSLLETFALVIPYYKLVLYKGKANEYSIHKDHYFITVSTDKRGHDFMRKILHYKADNSPMPLDEP